MRCACAPGSRCPAPTSARRWWPSAATGAASWRRTPTSTSSSCTTSSRTSTSRRSPARSGTRCGTRGPTSTTRCARWPQMVETAGSDLKVALGLLDVRHVAGDPNLTLRLRTTMLTEWRRDARQRLRALRALVDARHELMGELAHASVPDLKETEGGIRDATVLKALVATWLVDVPHVELERSRLAMLDVRDQVHALAGRATDRITPEMWSDLAPLLDVAGRPRRPGRGARARPADHAPVPADLAPRRRRAGPGRPPPGARRWRRWPRGWRWPRGRSCWTSGPGRPRTRPCCSGPPRRRPSGTSCWRPPTAARLARECAPLPTPWPAEARDLLVRLLASGRGLLGTWETLEETGALAGLLPEWERIRLLPHASEIHRFTVDRHVVETCIEASALIRRVDRPGRADGGGPAARHRQGQPHRAQRGRRAGGPGDRDPDGLRRGRRRARSPCWSGWHLLLAETATTRDPDDPATVQAVADRVGTRQALDLLTVLTEADARAASPKAWSSWRSGLILDLSRAHGRRPQQRPAPCRRSGPRRSRSPTWRGREPPRSRSRTSATAAGSPSSRRTGSACSPTSPRSSRCSGSRIRAARAWFQDGFGGLGVGGGRGAAPGGHPAPDVRRRGRGTARPGVPAAALGAVPAAAVGGRPPRGVGAGDRARGADDRPARRRTPGLHGARPARRHRAVGPRRHARAAGGRRVLPPGGLGRGAQRPAGGRRGARGQGCARRGSS